jgi:hypothetical protein
MACLLPAPAYAAEPAALGGARARREDREFQAHLERCRAQVDCVSPGPELYVAVRTLQPRVVVETGVASGWSSAHILRALEANGAGVLHSIDLPNVQEGSVLPAGLAAGGLLMSDDVHLHPAWDDFCAQHGLRPTRVGRLGVTRNHPGAA